MTCVSICFTGQGSVKVFKNQDVSSLKQQPQALIRYIDKIGRRPLAAIGIVGMLGGLLSRPQESAVTGTAVGQNHASQGETMINYLQMCAGLCPSTSPYDFCDWGFGFVWNSRGDALRLMVLGSLLRGAGVPVKITARATQTGVQLLLVFCKVVDFLSTYSSGLQQGSTITSYLHHYVL